MHKKACNTPSQRSSPLRRPPEPGGPHYEATCFFLVVASLLPVLGSTPSTLAAEPKVDHFAGLAEEYVTHTRPLLQQFCLKCHSTAKRKGELDLERFATLAEVRRGTKAWLKVVEMLDNGEMPPKESKQPSPAQRKQLHGWAERYLHAEALANAGDPGPVVLWQQPRLVADKQPEILLRDVKEIGGLDPAMFGKHPDGKAIDAASLCVRAPTVITIRLPADVVAGREFVTTAVLDKEMGGDGSVQLDVVSGAPAGKSGLLPSEVAVKFSQVTQVFADRRDVTFLRPISPAAPSTRKRNFPTAVKSTAWPACVTTGRGPNRARQFAANVLLKHADRYSRRHQVAGSPARWRWRTDSGWPSTRLPRQAEPQDVQPLPVDARQVRHSPEGVRRLQRTADRSVIHKRDRDGE